MQQDTSLPDLVLSFDPGGSEDTWAYCVSKLRIRNEAWFTPVEVGYIPVVPEIAQPNFDEHDSMLRYFNMMLGRIDLVAERFIGRGFTKKIAEQIPFELGWWVGNWKRGTRRLIMASQWKIPFKKWNPKFPSLEGYDNWWEWYYAEHGSTEDQRKGKVHIQDSIAIGYFYWRHILKVDCKIEGLVL